MNLKLFHCTSKEYYDTILGYGKLFSEKKARKLKLITQSSTGEIDRQYNRDRYVFLSHLPQNYGDVVMRFSDEVLNLPECYVATAGDFLNFCDTPESIKYFNDSIIPGRKFKSYFNTLLKKLPNPDWFWGKKTGLKKFLSNALIENMMGKPDNLRLYWSLFPEIMVKDELSLDYLINVIIK